MISSELHSTPVVVRSILSKKEAPGTIEPGASSSTGTANTLWVVRPKGIGTTAMRGIGISCSSSMARQAPRIGQLYMEVLLGMNSQPCRSAQLVTSTFAETRKAIWRLRTPVGPTTIFSPSSAAPTAQMNGLCNVELRTRSTWRDFGLLQQVTSCWPAPSRAHIPRPPWMVQLAGALTMPFWWSWKPHPQEPQRTKALSSMALKVTMKLDEASFRSAMATSI